MQVCRPRRPVHRARVRSEYFHARMECGIARRRSGRVGPEALRASIPSHRYAGECDLAVGLNRAACQWPALQGSWPGRECRRVPGRRRGMGRGRNCLRAPRASTTIVMSEFGANLPIFGDPRMRRIAPQPTSTTYERRWYPRAPIGHAHLPRGTRDRVSLADTFEQPGFAGTDPRS